MWREEESVSLVRARAKRQAADSVRPPQQPAGTAAVAGHPREAGMVVVVGDHKGDPIGTPPPIMNLGSLGGKQKTFGSRDWIERCGPTILI